MVLLALEPVFFTVVLFVPGLREFPFVVSGTGGPGSLVHPGVEQRLGMVLHFGSLFVAMLAESILFVGLFVRVRHRYRTQATADVVAAVAPYTTILVQRLGFAPTSDPSIFA